MLKKLIAALAMTATIISMIPTMSEAAYYHTKAIAVAKNMLPFILAAER
jgi:peptidoglycan hydrolase CwlO-like protein